MFKKTNPLTKLLKEHSGEMLVLEKFILVYAEGIDSVLCIPKEPDLTAEECQALMHKVATDLSEASL